MLEQYKDDFADKKFHLPGTETAEQFETSVAVSKMTRTASGRDIKEIESK